MSGKDTQGIRLAETLEAKYLSSGMIIRAAEQERHKDYSKNGELTPTDVFYELVLPYFWREDLADYPLVLSSIGRWSGEEDQIIATTSESGHETKAAILLNISENDVEQRFNAAKVLNDRGDRSDDKNLEIFHTRLKEFREKTLPVLQHYKSLGLLVEVNGDQNRNAVFNEIVEKLYKKASESQS